MSKRTLIELIYGQGAHANPLACIEDVPLDLAGLVCASFPHSIYQLASHMNFWMAYELKRIRGENPRYPMHASESWPAEPTPRAAEEWQETVSVFRELLAELATLADSPHNVLANEVAATQPDHTKRSSSLLAVLWQTVAHNSYHIGQVATVRRCLGAWPPKGGGDSW